MPITSPLPSTVGATHASIVSNDAGTAGATLVLVTCQHVVCRAAVVVVVIVVKVSMVCQLESWCIEGSEIDRGVQTVAMLITNSINHETLMAFI